MQELLKVLEAASQKLDAEVKIDYIATLLANFLLFEDDLQKRNRVQCLHLIGLAQRGLGQMGHAERSFRETLLLDINHLYAQQELRMWLPETRTA